MKFCWHKWKELGIVKVEKKYPYGTLTDTMWRYQCVKCGKVMLSVPDMP